MRLSSISNFFSNSRENLEPVKKEEAFDPQKKFGVDAILEQVYLGKIVEPYAEVYECYKKDELDVVSVINQYLHQQDQLFVYDRLMISLVENMLKNAVNFTNHVISLTCMWTILVERWEMVKHDQAQWKQNALRLRKCIQQAELKNKMKNANEMVSEAAKARSIITIDISGLDRILDSIFKDRKEAIFQQKGLTCDENIVLLREEQKEAIHHYIMDAASHSLGDLVFMYEKKLEVEHEQWQMTYRYSETEKLKTLVEDWTKGQKERLFAEHLSESILIDDFKTCIVQLVQRELDESCMLDNVPEEISKQIENEAYHLKSEFREQQKNKVEKLKEQLTSWFKSNRERLISAHSSLDNLVECFQDEILKFIRRRYPTLTMLDLAPQDIIQFVQECENEIWNSYQQNLTRLQRNFQSWHDSNHECFIKNSFDINGYDEAVKLELQDILDHKVPPVDFTAFVSDLRHDLEAQYLENKKHLIEDMKLKYIRWFSQNKEMYLKINNNVEEEMGIENISQKFQNESEIFLNKLMQKFSIHVMPRALQLIIHEKKNFLLQSLELQENRDGWKDLLVEMRLEQFISIFQENGFDDPSFWPELDDVTLKNALGLEKGNLLKWRRQFPEFYVRAQMSPTLTALTPTFERKLSPNFVYYNI